MFFFFFFGSRSHFVSPFFFKKPHTRGGKTEKASLYFATHPFFFPFSRKAAAHKLKKEKEVSRPHFFILFF